MATEGLAPLTQVPLANFGPESSIAVQPVLEGSGAIDTGAGAGAAGGVYVARGRQQGHVVSWRVQGAQLELSEASLVREPGRASGPGLAPDQAELALRFPAPLVPEVSLTQLGDDSLLLSAVTHAPAGGGYLFQLRFACAGGPAAAGRAFWLSAPPSDVLTKHGYADQVVGAKLGRLRLARFDAAREGGDGLVRQLLVLGGEGDRLSALEARTSFGAGEIETEEVPLSASRSRIYSIFGGGGGGAGSGAPLVDVALVGAPAAAAADDADSPSAIALYTDGRLGCWRLQGARTGGEAPAATAVSLQAPPQLQGGSAGAGAAGAALATWRGEDGVAVAVASPQHPSIFVSVRAALGDEEQRLAAGAFAAMNWRECRRPDAAPARARLLRLALARDSPGGASLALCALYGGVPPSAEGPEQPPSLFYACVPLAEAAPPGDWCRARLLCDAHPAPPLRLDGAAAVSAPLSSVTQRLLRQLAHPFRFTPRQLDAAASALLPPPRPSGGPPPPLSLRIAEGVERRLDELEASSAALAAAAGRPPPPREESELVLGEQMLDTCVQRKREQAEILGLQSLCPEVAGAPLALLSRSGLTLLLALPEGDPREIASCRDLLDLLLDVGVDCGVGDGVEALCQSPHPGVPPTAALIEAARCALARAPAGAIAGSIAAAEPQPPLLPTAAALLSSLTQLRWTSLNVGEDFIDPELIAQAWFGQLWSAPGWRAGDATGAAVAAAADSRRAVAHAVAASAARLAERGSLLCVHLLLLLLHEGVDGGGDTAGLLAAGGDQAAGGDPASPAGLAVRTARLACAHELLGWLAESEPAHLMHEQGRSLLEVAIRAAALPGQLDRVVGDHVTPIGDACIVAACALLVFVLNDVRIAEGDTGPLRAGVPAALSLLLARASCWAPLAAYLRRLGAPPGHTAPAGGAAPAGPPTAAGSPLHVYLGGETLLREGRYAAAARAFEGAMRGAEASRTSSLGELNRAVGVPPLSTEAPLESAAERDEWARYEYLAAVRSSFDAAGQADAALPFAKRALELRVIEERAPKAYAGLHVVAFKDSLNLGRLADAHEVLTDLHGCASSAHRRVDKEAEAVYRERRADCFNTLVSVLHARGGVAQLAKLRFDGELRSELFLALRRHAPASDVHGAAGPNAYELLYALQLQYGDYGGAARSMFELSARLENDVAAAAAGGGALHAPDLAGALSRRAAALSGCIVALEQRPPEARYVLEAADPSAEAAGAAGAFGDGSSRLPPGGAGRLVFAAYDGDGRLDIRAEPTEGALAASRAAAARPCPLERPVQLSELRQRRQASLGRAALLRSLGGEAAAHAGAIAQAPVPLLLDGLLRQGLFDDATALAVAYATRLRRHPALDGSLGEPSGAARPSGLPYVGAELARRACALASEGRPDAAADAWRKLHELLLAHDGAANNFSLSAAAVHAALAAAPAEALPSWLVAYFGAAPPHLAGDPAAPIELEVSEVGGASGDPRQAHRDAVSEVEKVLADFPATNAALHVRGVLGCGGDAHVRIVHGGEPAALERAHVLQAALCDTDPDLEPTRPCACTPLRRNPAALCRALLRHERTQLAALLRQLRLGCEAAVRTPADRAARWPTPGLIDDVFAAVAARQGVVPAEVSAERGVPGDAAATAELPRCVEAVDQYLDMDAAMAVAAEVSTPQYAREADWKRPRVVGSDGVFLQLLEAATRG